MRQCSYCWSYEQDYSKRFKKYYYSKRFKKYLLRPGLVTFFCDKCLVNLQVFCRSKEEQLGEKVVITREGYEIRL